MANSDGVEFRLFDTDLTSVLHSLRAQAMQINLILNEPGNGAVTIALKSRAALSAESAMFVEGKYRGGVRGGFFVEGIDKSIATRGENGEQLMALMGRGALALLDDAIVWGDGTSATTQEFTGTRAGMLISMIDAAQARGALLNLSYDFSAVVDSTAAAWTDNESLSWSNDTSLLDVARDIAKAGIDLDILPDGAGNFVLSAYKNGKGTDKSETVYFRVGKNCTEVSSLEDGSQIRNALKVSYQSGKVIVSDATSISVRRRREYGLNARAAQTAESATTIGAAELELRKDPRKSIDVAIDDGVGPRLFVDYGLGDYIMLDIEGVETKYRVRGIKAAWDGKKFANVVVNLNSIILENEILMGQDINWLLDHWETARDAGLLEVKFWAGFGDPNDKVQCIVVDGIYLYLGGQFTIIGGISANKIARYNTSTGEWTALGTGLSGTYVGGTAECVAITVMGGSVYAGGNFADAGGVTVRGIAKWDGSSWSKVGSGAYGGFNNSVTCLANDGTTLYAGGNFTHFFIAASPFQTACDYVAKFTGTTWVVMDSGIQSNCLALELDGAGNLWAGCGISGFPAYPTIEMWNGSTWITPADLPDNRVYTIKAIGTDVYFGGPFENVGSLPALHIAKWDGLSWSALGDGLSGAPGGNYALNMVSYLNDLYVVGMFKNQGNYIARWSGGSWWALGEGLGVNVYCVAVTDGKVYAGGEFATAGGKSSPNLAVFLTTFEAALEHLQNEAGNSFDMAAAIHRSTSVVPTDTSEVGIWYSVTTALAKVTFSNIWAYIKAKADLIYVALTGNQTIEGIKTFSDFPVTPSSAPTTDYQVANKKYVDDNAGGGGVTPVNPSVAGNLVSFLDTVGGQADSGVPVAHVLLGTGWPFNFYRLLYTDAVGNVTDDDRLVYDPTSGIFAFGKNDGSNNSNVMFGGNTGNAATPNTTSSFWRLINYGVTSTSTNLFKGTSARGTKAIPTASLIDDLLAHFNGAGYPGTGNVEDATSTGGMSVVANENQSATNRGTRLDFYSTPNAATAKVKAFSVNADGTVNIQSGKTYNVNGTPHTHPANVLIPFGVFRGISPITVNTYMNLFAIDKTYTFVKWTQNYYVETTNNASNYWNIEIRRLSDAAVINAITTVSASLNIWYRIEDSTFSIASAGTSATGLTLYCYKTGSPGALYVSAPTLEATPS